MHILSWLAVNGTAAIVEFPGVMYRGGVEQKIRKYLTDNNYVDAVIQLPPDLFFGTTIATCILVLKKSKKDNSVLFIDASAEFVRGGSKNKLTDANRQRILDAFTARGTSSTSPSLCRTVSSLGASTSCRSALMWSQRTHAWPSISRRSTPRSYASLADSPSSARRSTRSSRTWRALREPNRRPSR